ncbi:MAG TPA: ferrochelatase [Acetobacteraceae bacterium]|nr:ferrochelatase [Acetobacteraceae bacterium]
MSRLAIVLFNLGGPDSLAAVKPFLLNLFRDPAILRVPFFVRPFLARLIAARRVEPASANYALLGGKSPLLELTNAQAAALETELAGRGVESRAFVAMRYWHPFAWETARAVRAWNPDEIFLLPLYPQYSTTTTGSSLADWREAAARAGLAKPVTTLCCFYAHPAYIGATAAMVRDALAKARADTAAPVRVLFSAHGLPETIVQRGDPYQHQIESTVAAIVASLGEPGLDHLVCYQSRATPQKWLDPSTESAIEAAARDKVAVLVVPVAFVSEHSETLVELDVEYRELAEKLGVPAYFRAPAQNSDPGFIAALADVIVEARARGPGLCSSAGGRTCPAVHGNCPLPEAA